MVSAKKTFAFCEDFWTRSQRTLKKYRLHPVRTTPGKRGSKSDQTDEISEKILRSELVNGQTIVVDCKNDNLIFEIK